MAAPMFIDIHCHPSIKPFGHSYPRNKNSKKIRKKNSLWHKNEPTNLTEYINEKLTTTHFTQSDFQTLCEGNVRVIFASLSPLEQGFFVSKLGKGPLTDFLTQWVTGIGLRKINFIQKNKNYFSELKKEMNFYEQLHDKEIKIDSVKKKYRIVRNFSEIIQNMAESENIVSVVPCIEGGHVFTEDNSKVPDENKLMQNIDTVLSWEFKPFFLAPAHHFYNHLCGHAYSLSELVRIVLDQDDHVNTAITPLGLNVIRKLLDKEVLIDIKHMSRKSRRDFYSLIEEDKYKSTPIIVSHGNVNGRATVNSDSKHGEENGLFNGADINFYDDEIVKVGRSKGLFGIQLDERRIASKKEIDKIKKDLPEEVKLEMYSAFLWNQMKHIAKTLDSANINAWDCMCLGSDYDGAVDPMDGFWTSREFKLLYKYILQHAKNFLATTPNSFQKEENNIPAEKIVDKLFSKNVMAFLAANFN